MSGEYNDVGEMTFTAGEAIGASIRVYLSAARTVSIAGVNDLAIGVTTSAVASGAQVSVRLFGHPGTFVLTATSSASVNAYCYAAASGKVDDVAVGAPIGMYLEAPSGNGAQVEALHFGFESPALPTKITDPGNAGAIPVTRSGVCSITSGGAGHTRTMAIPTFDGQRITLTHDVDGGTAVITVASPFNETGNNTVTLTDAKESISFTGVRAAGVLRWQEDGNVGATLTTV